MMLLKRNFISESIIKQALKEDIGKGDITTNTLVSKERKVSAKIILKERAVVCGIEIVKQIFKSLDKHAKFKLYCKDGGTLKSGKTILKITASARAILSAERVALNFLSHLCGIATETQKFVNKIKPYKAKILDTRKTLPLLRNLEKYAVKCGGGLNHRLDLCDMVLIKDNHKKAQGKSFKMHDLIKKAKKKNKNKKIEVEVENLKEFKDALLAKPDIIMLDNMSLKQIKKAVNLLNARHFKTNTKLEASGNITLNNVLKVAKSGIDFISVGLLTHSAKTIDISLEII